MMIIMQTRNLIRQVRRLDCILLILSKKPGSSSLHRESVSLMNIPSCNHYNHTHVPDKNQ